MVITTPSCHCTTSGFFLHLFIFKKVRRCRIEGEFKEGELIQESTVKYYLTVQIEVNRTVKRRITWYNLDVIFLSATLQSLDFLHRKPRQFGNQTGLKAFRFHGSCNICLSFGSAFGLGGIDNVVIVPFGNHTCSYLSFSSGVNFAISQASNSLSNALTRNSSGNLSKDPTCFSE